LDPSFYNKKDYSTVENIPASLPRKTFFGAKKRTKIQKPKTRVSSQTHQASVSMLTFMTVHSEKDYTSMTCLDGFLKFSTITLHHLSSTVVEK